MPHRCLLAFGTGLQHLTWYLELVLPPPTVSSPHLLWAPTLLSHETITCYPETFTSLFSDSASSYSVKIIGVFTLLVSTIIRHLPNCEGNLGVL